ncbi:hypothetical protein CK203_029421 [Vitis vinifera]|uniref:Uncharacterized protein n=1 Tax=Vitis vinifera TaxID=29760 RepID=A0A438HX22_VITVI|nr:hypothetical protein CK203_029421 [Vitis vinifera]
MGNKQRVAFEPRASPKTHTHPHTHALTTSGHRGLHLHRLNFQEAENLEVPFSEEEIHSALLELNGDKAPRLDGFTVAFWQACWDFVKEEILELFKEFYDQKILCQKPEHHFPGPYSKERGAEDLGISSPLAF